MVPQPADRPPVPLAALVDNKLASRRGDGYRLEGMPREREAWRRGLNALDAEAQRAFGARFPLQRAQQDALLTRMQRGELRDPRHGAACQCESFSSMRLAHDIVMAYYSHPTAWNEIGWGGPASPARLCAHGLRPRDPWEAVEAKHGDVAAARRKNRHVR